MFVEMSDIDFMFFVNIGDFVCFKCKVLYTVNAEEARCGKSSVYFEVCVIVINFYKVIFVVVNKFFFKFNVVEFVEVDGMIMGEFVRFCRVFFESNDEALLIWDKCIWCILCDDNDFDVCNNLSMMMM